MLLEIFDPKAMPRPIGIDLGTTHSLVACIRNDRPEVLADCHGETLLPSVVSYADDASVLAVGSAAKSAAATRPETTISSAKRWMGKGASEGVAHLPYRFLAAQAGEANVARFDIRGHGITPVEVSAEILRELKRRAEDELGKVGGVVITVPAYFDDAARQATKDAGRLAGLEVLRLINEPTAAALAYGLESKKNGKFAVFDLGGGTFDITILLLDDGVFQVKSTGGDAALGGDDMDLAIVDDWKSQLGWQDPPEGLKEMPAVVMRLFLDQARAAKHALTDHLSVEVELPNAQGTLARVAMSRARFEELIAPLLARTGAACKRAMKDAGLKSPDLDGVILVGGATRVPAVREYVAKLFERMPLSDIDPDQVVALGAAIQADLLAGNALQETALLLDVTPLSLGIEVGGGVVDKILPRNTTVPTKARATYTTQEDNQTGFDIHVVQGERELAKDCRSLARFLLRGIPPMAAGLAKLEVTFAVDADGLLVVSAKELTTGVEQQVSVKPTYGLDDDAVEQMLLESIEYGAQDLEARKLYETRSEASRILRGTQKAVADDAAMLSSTERTRIERCMVLLEEAISAKDAKTIQLRMDDLDHATRDFAKRRMNRAIAQAIEGKSVNAVEV